MVCYLARSAIRPTTHNYPPGHKTPGDDKGSLAVTTISVPLSEYILHTHVGSSGVAATARHFRSRDLGCSGVVLCYSLMGQGASPVCELSRPRSEWVPGWTVIVCLNSVQRHDGSRAVCSPWS